GPLPVTLLAGAAAAVDILLSDRLADLHHRLWKNQARAIAAVRSAGLTPMSSGSPVVCVDFVDMTEFARVVTTLHRHQILASVVAFPAVPRGHYRIRLSISAAHTDEDMRRLSDAFQRARSRTVERSAASIAAS